MKLKQPFKLQSVTTIMNAMLIFCNMGIKFLEIIKISKHTSEFYFFFFSVFVQGFALLGVFLFLVLSPI